MAMDPAQSVIQLSADFACVVKVGEELGLANVPVARHASDKPSLDFFGRHRFLLVIRVDYIITCLTRGGRYRTSVRPRRALTPRGSGGRPTWLPGGADRAR